MPLRLDGVILESDPLSAGEGRSPILPYLNNDGNNGVHDISDHQQSVASVLGSGIPPPLALLMIADSDVNLAVSGAIEFTKKYSLPGAQD